MEILNKRPESMSYVDYKIHMKEQKKWIKEHRKGVLYYKSAELYYAPEDKNHLFGLRTTYNPFKGKMKDLQYPIISN